MGESVFVIFGYFEKDDLIYYYYLQDLFENLGIKLHLFGWKNQVNLFKKFD